MPITLPAPFPYAGGFAAGTNTTTIVRANADLAAVDVGGVVVNNTRGGASKIIVVKSIGATNTTLTLEGAIASQTTTDNITFNPCPEVAGHFSGSFTATTYTATTIGYSNAAWTANALIDRFIWIISGAGTGASGHITANTTTVATCLDGFFRLNTTTKALEKVTPDATSVFAVAYNYADCIAALATIFSWDNATTQKTLRSNQGILVKSGGSLADINKHLEFTTPETAINTESGSFFQNGRLTPSFSGSCGGDIVIGKTSTTAYLEATVAGIFNVYGGAIVVNKSAASEAATVEFRLNAMTVAAWDGAHYVNTRFWKACTQSRANDVFQDVELVKARIGGQDKPAIQKRVLYTESMQTISPLAPGGSGIDLFDLTFRGKCSGTALFRPIVIGNSVLPYSVGYMWRPDFGTEYASLADVVDWYATPYAGIGYLGLVLDLATKTSGAANLGSVAVGIIKASDGTGQIITGKGNAAANYAPIKARFITTDANGAYVGPFGSGEGIFVHRATLTHGTSNQNSVVVNFNSYALVFTKYGYVQQVLSRDWSFSQRNAETAYLAADPYITVAYATVIAYTGITVAPATPSTGAITLSSAHTFAELYHFIKARVEYEAKTNDVAVIDPLITTDDLNYTFGSGWTITGIGNLTFGTDRLAGGKIIFSTVGTYTVRVGTIALEFTAASGTYDLRTSNISGTVTLTNSGGGSITVLLPVGITVVNTGPNITVDQSASVNVVLSGFVAGSRIQIWDTNAATQVYNGVPAASPLTVAMAYVADKPLRIRCAKQATTTAKNFVETTQTLGSGGLSYAITQTDDTTYNTNAIDGSGVTGITITPSPQRVVINIAGGSVTWPQIYAYQTYWLATATGIADEAAFINAPDTANYLLTGFDIKNTSTVPLTITGGYGRDAVTGMVKDCIDTAGSAGNIFPMPDHAIPYSSGSGLTAGQDANLTAAVTAANTAASQAAAAKASADAALATATLIAGYTDSIESRLPATLVGGKMDAVATVSGVPTAAENAAASAAAVAALPTSAGYSLLNSLRISDAINAGPVSGAGTGTEVFSDPAGTKPVVTFTVDANGNRTAVIDAT